MINVGDLVTLNKKGRERLLPWNYRDEPIGLVIQRPYTDRHYKDTHKFNRHFPFKIVWMKYRRTIPQYVERKWIKMFKKASS